MNKQNNDLFRLLVSSVFDYAIFSLDSAGNIVSWNEGAHRIKGYEEEEILGKHISVFYTPEDVEAGKPQLGLEIAAAEGHFEDSGWRVRKDGTQIWANVVITPLRDNTGNVCGFAKVTRDITERKKFEQDLEKARDQALEASRFKSEFLANMSHEVRTPMNSILGMAEILSTSDLTAEQMGQLNHIIESGKSLLSIIDDILDFSKIEAGKLTLEEQDFAPLAVVEGVAELLSTQTRKKGLSMMTFVDPQIPPTLRGDAGRIRQILVNFAHNAIKFAQSGSIVVRASFEGRDQGQVTVKFSVTDQGIGMTGEELDQLFQPFVQLDGSLTRKYEGTGLGLSICKRLVEKMQGEIGVHSVKGTGSTFWFSIPLKVSTTSDSSRAPHPNLKKTRILIVDDDQNVLDIVGDYTSAWGMQNGKARSAEEALVVLRKSAKIDPYEVVLIDLLMSGMTGMEFGKIIREDEKLKSLKLILVTAYDKPGLGEEAICLGFNGYLVKPIRQSQLLDCITSLVVLASTQQVQGTARQSDQINVAGLKPPTRSELILVVEDHPINQEVALLLLKRFGFEAHVASNGAQALEHIQSIPYALVLMDCQMPVMSGFEATSAIRKLETRTGKHVPIVAMTAHAIEGSREQCLAAGMDDYLSKPIDPKLLNHTLQKYLPLSDTSSPFEPESSKPIDLNKLKHRYGEEEVDSFVRMFLGEIPDRIAEMRQLVASSNTAEMLNKTHALKGVCATMAAGEMYQECHAIEAACRDQDWAKTKNLIDDLASKFEELQRYVAEGSVRRSS
jgi:two-component system, sensor histidine kinase and response regulator